MTKKTVLCMFGGKSTEYEVSLMSVSSVLPALDPEKYNLVLLGITREGLWYQYSGPWSAIRDGSWCKDPAFLRPAMLSPSFGDGSLLTERAPGQYDKTHIDVVIPVMHGGYAEDGTLQGLLSITGIPYVGPHCAASAAAMDKAFTKLILNGCGIPQAACAVLTKKEYDKAPETVLDRAEAVSAYPLFVKPANAGSSVGVSKAENRDELRRALETAFRYDSKVLAEECIIGQEIECAVLGNDDPVPSVPGEIHPGSDFYDYDTKYVTDTSSDYIPARISPESAAQVQAYAVKIFTILGCKGLSRADFFVKKDGSVVFNEINTLPGFTRISMYPKLWNYMGKTTAELLDCLIALAEEANA